MQLDRRTLRVLALSGLFLGLLGVSWLLASGLLKTILFVALAISGISVSAVLWPEILVMGYLFAGRYSYEERLAPGDIPVSVNQMMLVGLVVLALLNGRFILRTAKRWSFIGLLMFSLALALGLGWSLGLNYGFYKVSRTWLVIMPSVLMAGALVERRGSLVPLMAAAFVIGFALNTAGLLTFEQSLSSNSRLSSLGSGPNIFARTVGLSLMIALFTMTWLVQRGMRTMLDRVVVVGCALSFLWLLPGFVLAQSRGPALALSVAVAFVVLLSLWGNWRTAFAGVVALLFSAWAGSLVIETLLSGTRFDITQKSNMVSMDARVELLWRTWDLIIEQPVLGVGTGAWPVYIFGIDERSYPHNFFAEIAVENGILLAGLIAVLFVFVIGRGLLAWTAAREPASRFVLMGSLAAFVFFMLNISVTGDSIDNRLIWLTLLAVEISASQTVRQVTPAVARRRLVPVGLGARSSVSGSPHR